MTAASAEAVTPLFLFCRSSSLSWRSWCRSWPCHVAGERPVAEVTVREAWIREFREQVAALVSNQMALMQHMGQHKNR